VNGFRLLRMQQFFQTIEKDEYVVWADCGKHFRNNEFVGYLLLELAENNKHGLLLFSLIKLNYKHLLLKSN
jgi:hypothetical protein